VFGESIEWLKYAGVVLKCQKTAHGSMPVKVYVDLSDFKLYLSDVGLLTMQSGIAVQAILSPLETGNAFLGAIAENYVAQAFAANRIPLLYWKNDNTAEVDFVIQKGTDVIPVEVKAGVKVRSSSSAPAAAGEVQLPVIRLIILYALMIPSSPALLRSAMPRLASPCERRAKPRLK
jgi:hypothetical protein